MEFELTKEEQNSINTLERLAKRWPKSPWIFANPSGLSIMRSRENGDMAFTPIRHVSNGPSLGGGVDPDCLITSIDIPCDGGDW